MSVGPASKDVGMTDGGVVVMLLGTPVVSKGLICVMLVPAVIKMAEVAEPNALSATRPLIVGVLPCGSMCVC
jgi:hypothetical protein